MNRSKFKTFWEKIQSLWRKLEDITQISKEKPKDVNIQLVGLGNTRVLTIYAQNIPGHSYHIQHESSASNLEHIEYASINCYRYDGSS